MRRRPAVLLALIAAFAGAPVAGRTATATQPPVDVAIVTALGTIVVAIDTLHAPVTAKNSLRHVDARAYAHASFYRSVRTTSGPHRLMIVQGGIDPKDDAMPPIALESTATTGLHNAAGTIAMAREAAPNTANSEFYINTGDNRRLDADPARGRAGYAVFGHVIHGEAVAEAIQRRPVRGEALDPRIPIIAIERVRP
jgi:peptidyl-prolyl cis-trans isomerase A (cyclophilin A)